MTFLSAPYQSMYSYVGPIILTPRTAKETPRQAGKNALAPRHQQEVVEVNLESRASCLPTPAVLSWHRERPSRHERK